MSVDINVATSGYGGALLATSANIPYVGWIDTATNCTVSASDPSNPRIDALVAYVDLTAISSAVTNNVGAFKFKAVTGTPAGSPSAPNSSAIQTSIGTGNPYVTLATISVAAAASSVVNANITDTRVPAALNVSYLWGGSSNTKGHLVPNSADATVVVTSTGGVRNSDLSNPYKFRAYRNSALNTTAGSFAKVPFDSENFDTGGNFDSTTNNRFTAAVAGFYQFQARCEFVSTSSQFLIALYKNGSAVSYGVDVKQNASTTGVVVADLIQLSANDYVEVFIFSNSTVAYTTGSISTYFSGYMVSAT